MFEYFFFKRERFYPLCFLCLVFCACYIFVAMVQTVSGLRPTCEKVSVSKGAAVVNPLFTLPLPHPAKYNGLSHWAHFQYLVDIKRCCAMRIGPIEARTWRAPDSPGATAMIICFCARHKTTRNHQPSGVPCLVVLCASV